MAGWEKYREIFSRAEDLVKKTRQMINSHDVNGLGKLMDENHSLLREIEVSSPELEKLCEIAKENGALGAKLTGAGGGGFMIALAENGEIQERIAKAFESAGFEALKTIIGG